METQSKLLLIGETFSPWTKKARWALEYCGLTYDYKEYIPTLSELGLRLRLKQWSGTVSVPILFVRGKALRGSWEIATYANNAAGGARLGDFKVIEQWNDLSETALAAGRTAVVRSILDNKQALEEGLPPFVPKLLRRPLRIMAYDAVKRLDHKYAHLVKPGALRQALLKTREGLSQSGNDYLLGDFSYADITMAAVLEVIAPLAKAEPPLGPATQLCWNKQELTNEFEDLIDWRARLAAKNETTYSQFI